MKGKRKEVLVVCNLGARGNDFVVSTGRKEVEEVSSWSCRRNCRGSAAVWSTEQTQFTVSEAERNSNIITDRIRDEAPKPSMVVLFRFRYASERHWSVYITADFLRNERTVLGSISGKEIWQLCPSHASLCFAWNTVFNMTIIRMTIKVRRPRRKFDNASGFLLSRNLWACTKTTVRNQPHGRYHRLLYSSISRGSVTMVSGTAKLSIWIVTA